MPAAKASLTRAHAAGSFTTTGKAPSEVISGAAGAPEAAASAVTMRSIAAEHLAAHRLVEGADREQQFGLVGDDVRHRARVQRADRDHGGVGGRDLPGDDALQPLHGRGGHQHRVDRGLRARAVTALAVQHDAERVGGGERRAGPEPEQPGRDRRDVLAEHHVGHPEPVEQAVVDHRLGALADLLGGLEDEQQRCRSSCSRSAASSAAAPSRQVTCAS